jgi:hypothetical protein
MSGADGQQGTFLLQPAIGLYVESITVRSPVVDLGSLHCLRCQQPGWGAYREARLYRVG